MNRPRLTPVKDKLKRPSDGFEFERLLHNQFSDAMSLDQFIAFNNPSAPANPVRTKVDQTIELDDLCSTDKKLINHLREIALKIGVAELRNLVSKACRGISNTTDRTNQSMFQMARVRLNLGVTGKMYIENGKPSRGPGGGFAADLSRAIDKINFFADDLGLISKQDRHTLLSAILSHVRDLAFTKYPGANSSDVSMMRYEQHAINCLQSFRTVLGLVGIKTDQEYIDMVGEAENARDQ